MEIILLFIRLFLFGVFALAGVTKLLDLKGSEKAVKEFGMPEELATTFAIVLPFAEMVFAVCFLFVEMSWIGSIGALILLLSFIGAMIWQISQGYAPDCHCFGQIHSEPVGKKTLVRNIGIAILALFLAVQGRDGQGMSLAENNSDMIQILGLLSILVVSAVVIFYLKRISEQQTEIIRRIDVLETISHDGVALQRQEAGDPHDGLPIGAPFPDFEMPDLEGKLTELGDLLSNRKAILFLFVSPTCEPCKALIPDIETWQHELSDKLNIVLISTGNLEDNRDKFGGLAEKVLVEKKREFAESVMAKWTPTAVMTGADGKITSHPAAGDAAIRELVEKVKASDLSQPFIYFTSPRSQIKPPKIGKTVPEFSLEDIEGNPITHADFSGRKTLAVSWSTTCPHCAIMMDELKEWDVSKNGMDLNLIVFSQGDKDDLSVIGLKSPIVIDEKFKISNQIGMHGTPSAVLIDENGVIVSEAAIGSSNIWALIGRR